MSSQSNYDVVIVGGGIAGALVAKRLAENKQNVLLIEAGIKEALDPSAYRQVVQRYYTMAAGRSAPNGPWPVNASALSPNDSAGDNFYVSRGPQNFLSDYLRQLGGTTLHWQGTSVRMLPN